MLKIWEPTVIFLDNDSTRLSSGGLASGEAVRDLNVKHYAILEHVRKGRILLKRVDTKENTADLLTKSLPRITHESHVTGLGLENSWQGGQC